VKKGLPRQHCECKLLHYTTFLNKLLAQILVDDNILFEFPPPKKDKSRRRIGKPRRNGNQKRWSPLDKG
jgi:hypothetical protein